MSCEICKRSNCTRSFHSIRSQNEYDRLSELYNRTNLSLSELYELEEKNKRGMKETERNL